MTELAELQELVGRGGYYAALSFSTDTADPANGALLQWVQEQETAIQTTLLFFELEWAALDDQRAEELLAHDGLDFCRHHLRNIRRYRSHLLTEPEERILTEKSLTGAGAWTRLFEELTSVIEVELPGPATGEEPRRCRSKWPSAACRWPTGRSGARSAEAVTAALAPGPSHTGLPVQHAACGQGHRRPPALLRPLAGGPKPRQRGERRVRGRPDRGGPGPL